MIDFKEIELKDKIWVDELLAYSDYRATEYSFSVLYIWKDVFKTQIGRFKDFLVVRFEPRHTQLKNARYFFPAGKGEIREALEYIMEDARKLEASFSLVSVLEEQKKTLEALYPGKFTYTLNRNSFDYIYLAESLITLKGKKYQSKRNFVSRFKSNPDWSYEPINDNNIEECVQMNTEWCRRYGCLHDASMAQENCSVKSALNHFNALNLKGGLLRLSGKVVAFSLGEKINSDTFLVHIEKAFADIQGAYPTISQEFLQHQMMDSSALGSEITPQQIGFTYVNREDDAGDEGLRKAKTQYHPIFMIEKYIVIESEK